MGRSREENRQYMRDYRARKAGQAPAPTAAGEPVTAPEAGSAVAGVQAELGTLSAASAQPGVAAACLALAKVLDDSSAVPQHAAAARTLGDLLGRLRSDSRLHSSGTLHRLRGERDRPGPTKKAGTGRGRAMVDEQLAILRGEA